jgi:hypothetical protein
MMKKVNNIHPYLYVGLNRRLIFFKDRHSVITYVANIFNLSVEDITENKSRKHELLFPRYICVYLLRMNCRYSFEKIGNVLSGLDHTTIMNAYKNILDRSNNPKLDKMFKQAINDLDYKQFYKRLEDGESYEALYKFLQTMGR